MSRRSKMLENERQVSGALDERMHEMNSKTEISQWFEN